MRLAWRWVRKWSWLLLAGIGAVLALILLRRDPRAVLRRERDAIDSQEHAELRALELGEAEALREIDAQHAETLRRLSSDRDRRRAELLRDPGKRARWLTRLASGRDS